LKTAREYLEELVKIGPRGPGTEGERKAAEYIARELKRMGYNVEWQGFKTTRDNLYLLPLQVAVLLCFSASISLKYGGLFNILALLLSILGLSLFLLEVSGVPIETSFMPRYQSQNVFTRFNDSGKKLIIVSAHYDTQRASILFHPKLVDYLGVVSKAIFACFLMVPIGILLSVFNIHSIAEVFLRAGLVATAIITVLMFFCEVTGRYVQGANDNGSGVALTLALAEYFANHRSEFPENVDIVFLFTGSEEAGVRGMKHFIKTYSKILPRDTQFIILDNLGAGKITFLEGEGIVFYRKAGKILLEIAEEMRKKNDGRVQKMKNLLLPTDALAVMAAGFNAIAFLGKDEKGRIANYHWYTDTIENVDMNLLQYAEEFFKEYLIRVAKTISRNT